MLIWIGYDRRNELIALWLVSAATLPVLVMLPNTPAHDGIRLFLPALFFAAMIAGYSFDWLARRTVFRRPLLASDRSAKSASQMSSKKRTRRPVRPVEIITVSVLFIPVCIWTTWNIHPAELSYYNLLVGGFSGAAEPVYHSPTSPVNPRPAYEITYWWDCVDVDAWQEMQSHLPQGAALWVFPDFVGLQRFEEWGLLREDLQIVRQPMGAEYVMIYGRLGRITPHEVHPLGQMFFNRKPIWEHRLHGVRVAGLYRWP